MCVCLCGTHQHDASLVSAFENRHTVKKKTAAHFRNTYIVLGLADIQTYTYIYIYIYYSDKLSAHIRRESIIEL